MLLIISPAKTMDYRSPLLTKQYTQPQLLDQSEQLIANCRQLTPAQLASLMKISDQLAGLNTTRFLQWQKNTTLKNARQAILAFKGDVYLGLNADDFTQTDFDFAQSHLRILSGLYGILRPLDLIQPYRLEMGTKLNNKLGRNLYQFWGNLITEKLNQVMHEQKHNVLVNLASDEYVKSVNAAKLQGTIIKPIFLDQKNGQYKIISIYAKKARGLMSRFIIKNRLTKSEQLTGFNLEGYQFSSSDSQGNQLVFKRSK